ncbi:hypothetical protein K3720_16940 [Leisingera caerulea]|uniref:hypothetical protein n=1 Tax=Leisingera caerulea TaxID=506591 RepID=UPI0021A3B425|nr:hypothetical protein [Leisingera caerulea]UWQ49563.1 hypothetical protein K3720_16940 [Leisingera caerulea]
MSDKAVVAAQNRRILFSFVFTAALAVGSLVLLNRTLLNGVLLQDLHYLYLGGAFMINLFAIYYYIVHPNAGFASIQVSYYFAFGALFPALVYTSIGLYPWPIAYQVVSQELLRETSFMCLVFSLFLHAGIFYGMRGKYLPPARRTAGLSAKMALPVLLAGYFFTLLLYAWIGLDIITTPRIQIEHTLSDAGEPRFAIFKRVSLLLFALSLVAGFIARNDPHPKNRRIFLWLFVVMAATLFVFVNPVNSARWRLIGFVASFILLFAPLNSTAAKFWTFWAMFAGSILLYPLLSVFSRTSRQWDRISSGAWQEFFAAGDFDGYQSMMHGVYWAQEFGLYLGSGLVNSALSFIPRQVWPDKPVHSGQIVSEWLGSANTNLSMPLFGEAYLNFHLFGAILIFFAGFAVARIDKLLRSEPSATLSYFAALVVGGSMLFITRGALQAVTEFVWQIMILIALTVWICRKKRTRAV